MKTARMLPVILLVFTACTKSGGPSLTPVDKKIAADTSAAALAVAATCGATKADAENLPLFPPNNPWHLDISNAPVDRYSTQIIAKYAATGLHPDFGSGLIDGATFGYPFMVVCGTQPKFQVVYRANAIDGNFGNESDPGPFPIPLNAPIEQSGDGHVIVVDEYRDILYELYNANVKNGHWEASSGAKFNMRTNTLRPDGRTSADAAGLPIFAGLVRYDEVVKGVINHAIRFTLPKSDVLVAHISPARHHVTTATGVPHAALPFGARLRLKASFNIASYPPHVKTILTAFKKYGIILADIGSTMYISGSQDDRWNNDELANLHKVKASDFEVIKFNP